MFPNVPQCSPNVPNSNVTQVGAPQAAMSPNLEQPYHLRPPIWSDPITYVPQFGATLASMSPNVERPSSHITQCGSPTAGVSMAIWTAPRRCVPHGQYLGTKFNN